jgi:hypothetical protein
MDAYSWGKRDEVETEGKDLEIKIRSSHKAAWQYGGAMNIYSAHNAWR